MRIDGVLGVNGVSAGALRVDCATFCRVSTIATF